MAVVISLAKDLILFGSLPTRANTSIQLLFLVLAVSAIVIRREWFHKFIALLTSALFAPSIVLLVTQRPPA